MLRDRFSRALDPAAAELSSSVGEDRHLLAHDLWVSAAHARMLGETGLIPARSAGRLLRSIAELARDSARGRMQWVSGAEDVHLAVESELRRRIGTDADRLHTGRSRNDLVATDLLLYTRDALLRLESDTRGLATALLDRAESTDGMGVVPAWTHMQPAQRVYWAQLLASYAWMFVRDARRFQELRSRLDESPLGSAAIAGSSLPLDRQKTARWLGFARPGRSSVVGVADRDFAVELLFDIALTQVHSSQLAEELVVGAMAGVERVRISDAFVTTSSLMPHKRNPDIAELVRGESGPAIGRVVAHLAVTKGLPLGYHRDLQVAKPVLFEGVHRASLVLRTLQGMIRETRFRADAPELPSETGSVELADELVRAGVPFRQTHRRIARYLARSQRGSPGSRPHSPSELERVFPEIKGRGFLWPTAREEPDLRVTSGGSSRESVRMLVRQVRETIRTAGRSSDVERRRVARLRRAFGIPGSLFDTN